MKRLIGSFAAVAVVFGYLSHSALAFSSSPLTYSASAISQLIELPKLPNGTTFPVQQLTNNQIPGNAEIFEVSTMEDGSTLVLARQSDQRFAARVSLGALKPAKVVADAVGADTQVVLIRRVPVRQSYEFDVTAQNGRKVRVKFDTSVPPGFIGNGLPHHPVVVSE